MKKYVIVPVATSFKGTKVMTKAISMAFSDEELTKKMEENKAFAERLCKDNYAVDTLKFFAYRVK